MQFIFPHQHWRAILFSLVTPPWLWRQPMCKFTYFCPYPVFNINNEPKTSLNVVHINSVIWNKSFKNFLYSLKKKEIHSHIISMTPASHTVLYLESLLFLHGRCWLAWIFTFVNMLLALIVFHEDQYNIKISNFKLGISDILLVCLLLCSLGVYNQDYNLILLWPSKQESNNKNKIRK